MLTSSIVELCSPGFGATESFKVVTMKYGNRASLPLEGQKFHEKVSRSYFPEEGKLATAEMHSDWHRLGFWQVFTINTDSGTASIF